MQRTQQQGISPVDADELTADSLPPRILEEAEPVQWVFHSQGPGDHSSGYCDIVLSWLTDALHRDGVLDRYLENVRGLREFRAYDISERQRSVEYTRKEAARIEQVERAELDRLQRKYGK